MSHYSITPADEAVSSAEPEVDPVKFQQMLDDIKANESLTLAVAGGFLAAIGAAVAWAAISYGTGYQIGFMAIGVGILVGYAVRQMGKGYSSTYGIVGAAFSLFGCLLGNLLMAVLFISSVEGSSTLAVAAAFLTEPGIVPDIMAATFSPIDLLFYGIAVFQGYKMSLRQLSEEEMASVRKGPISLR